MLVNSSMSSSPFPSASACLIRSTHTCSSAIFGPSTCLSSSIDIVPLLSLSNSSNAFCMFFALLARRLSSVAVRNSSQSIKPLLSESALRKISSISPYVRDQPKTLLYPVQTSSLLSLPSLFSSMSRKACRNSFVSSILTNYDVISCATAC